MAGAGEIVSHPAAASAGVEVRHLYKVFGPEWQAAICSLKAGKSKETVLADQSQVVAVNDVSFSVLPGEIFVVMGLSGSGKSTLVRCINRLIEPSAGQILIDGVDIVTASDADLRQARQHKVAMVFQHFALFPHRTVSENVEYGLKVRGLASAIRRAKAAEMLELVGLSSVADRFPDELSGGMRQRVGLARALAVEPKVLLMDEPFSALDPITRGDLQNELMRIRSRLNTAIIFITHDIDEALKLGDRVAVMKDGSFVQVGRGVDIALRPDSSYVAAFTREVDLTRLLDAAAIMRPVTIAAHPGTHSRIAAAGIEETYAVDSEDRPIALLLGADRNDKRSDLLARHGFPAVSGSTKLNNFLSACKSGLPVAVLDAQGRLCGVVTPADVMSALAAGASDAAAVTRLGLSESASVVPLPIQAKQG